jgi:hypothetical protein
VHPSDDRDRSGGIGGRQRGQRPLDAPGLVERRAPNARRADASAGTTFSAVPAEANVGVTVVPEAGSAIAAA